VRAKQVQKHFQGGQSSKDCVPTLESKVTKGCDFGLTDSLLMQNGDGGKAYFGPSLISLIYLYDLPPHGLSILSTTTLGGE
jgi:hypothetical protein